MRVKTFVKLLLIVPVIFATLFSFVPAQAAEPAAIALPSFEKFVSTLTNGQAGIVRGVYVPEVLALRVQPQPAGRPTYVSAATGVATQFQLAADQGILGLLAHNYLAGKSFSNLAIGNEVRIVYGDGQVKTYIVSDIYQYQALDPASPYSDLIDLNTNTQVPVADVFNTVYGGEDHVTFQTCIAKGRNLIWGRFFAVAYPAP